METDSPSHRLAEAIHRRIGLMRALTSPLIAPGAARHAGRRLGVASVAVGALMGFAGQATAGEILRPPGANPDGRGYEMVSPADKNFSDVPVTASRIRSTPQGSEVTYISTAAFAGAPGTADVVQYMAKREDSGWTTRALTPRQQTDEFSFIKNSAFRVFSDDLTKAVFLSGEPRPNPDAPADVRNLYVRDNVDNSYDVVTTIGPNNGLGLYTEPHYAAASDDFSHVLFESNAALTPDAPADGQTKLYESIDGDVRLAGVLPDGSPASGSVAGVGAGAGDLQTANNYTRRTISADGSRVIFTETATGQIFLRVDGETTVQVSRSQATVPDPAGTQPATYRGASVDGNRILFTSCERLTDDSSADAAGCGFGGGSADLYEYDADADRLTLLSVDREAADGVSARVQGIIGSSEDGSHVYFVASSQLTSDAAATPGASNLYVWNDGQIRYVAEFNGSDDSDGLLWRTDWTTGQASRVTADGEHALFVTWVSQPGYDNRGSRQVYLYDAADGRLRCVSCGDGRGAALGHAELAQVSPGVPAGKNEYRNRALLEDGSMVFFSTPEPLVEQDSNGQYDAYQFDTRTGEASLLSTGEDSADSYFVEASADGRDAFFVTRERLSARDVDNNNDLYNASAGGGIPEPDEVVSTPCVGDQCQGTPSNPPAPNQPGSIQEFPNEGDDPDPIPAVVRSVTVGKVSRAALRRFGSTGKVTLSLRVVGGGTVKASASGKIGRKSRTVASASKRVSSTSATTVKLTLRLSRAARRQLSRSGRLKLSLNVSLPGAPAKKTSLTVTRKRG